MPQFWLKIVNRRSKRLAKNIEHKQKHGEIAKNNFNSSVCVSYVSKKYFSEYKIMLKRFVDKIQNS